MKYIPDHKYTKSKDLIDYLTNGKPLKRSSQNIDEEEMLDLLLYHIKKKEEYVDTLEKRIKEYDEVFEGIAKFTNRKNVYR